MRVPRIIRYSRFTLVSLVLVCAVLLPSAAALVQATRSSASSEQSARNNNVEMAKESREAAGEDEQAQFKHSASVQLVARLTGLSLEHAYWLCVLLNFAVIAGTIFYFSKKNLPGVFRGRTAFIQKAMQEARQASEEANHRLAEIESGFPGWPRKLAGWAKRQRKKQLPKKRGSRLRRRRMPARLSSRPSRKSRQRPSRRVAN